jgi:hypothetical protein
LSLWNFRKRQELVSTDCSILDFGFLILDLREISEISGISVKKEEKNCLNADYTDYID